MKWGNENASDSEIWDALKVAQAKEVVEGKDGQLDFSSSRTERTFPVDSVSVLPLPALL